MKSVDLPRLYTAADVAGPTGLSQWTVYRLHRAGILPAVHMGKREVRFPEPAVREWLQGERVSKRNGAE